MPEMVDATAVIERFIEDTEIVSGLLDLIREHLNATGTITTDLFQSAIQPLLAAKSASYWYAKGRGDEGPWYTFWGLEFLQYLSIFAETPNGCVLALPHPQLSVQASVEDFREVIENAYKEITREVTKSQRVVVKETVPAPVLHDLQRLINDSRSIFRLIPDFLIMSHQANVTALTRLAGLNAAIPQLSHSIKALHEAKRELSAGRDRSQELMRIKRDQLAWQTAVAFGQEPNLFYVIRIITIGGSMHVAEKRREDVVLPVKEEYEDVEEGGTEASSSVESEDEYVPEKPTQHHYVEGGPINANFVARKLAHTVVGAVPGAGVKHKGELQPEPRTETPRHPSRVRAQAQPRAGPLPTITDTARRSRKIAEPEEKPESEEKPSRPKEPKDNTAKTSSSTRQKIRERFSNGNFIEATDDKEMEEMFGLIRTRIQELSPELFPPGVKTMSLEEVIRRNIVDCLATAFQQEAVQVDLRDHLRDALEELPQYFRR
ncbi:hypothetical protein C8Q79DRAFT_1008134 [Trametes meyenii]|nr:hypothetical protein C8Q79DRAFT_1008134 [Trametes meyenii]